MEYLHDLLAQIPSVEEIIRWGGTLVLIAIIFAETGLLIGFFLPGDSLLVTAGVFAAAGYLNVWVLLFALSLAAVVGDQVGYMIGKSLGARLYARESSRLFRRDHLLRAHEFYEKYGGKTIVIARLVPIVRTFAPTVAGAANMSYTSFVSYNVFGGILWVWSMVLAGYSLRSVFSWVLGREVSQEELSSYLHYIIAIVIFLSLLPPIVEYLRERQKKAKKAAEAAD
jgi:membrane-associated protein